MRSLKRCIVAALAASAVAGSAVAQDLKFGAMPLNTWWYVAGASVAALVGPQLPKGGTIEVLARGGGIANPVVVNDNKAQVAMSNVATSKWAWDGEAELYKGRKHQNIRSLVGGVLIS